MNLTINLEFRQSIILYKLFILSVAECEYFYTKVYLELLIIILTCAANLCKPQY